MYHCMLRFRSFHRFAGQPFHGRRSHDQYQSLSSMSYRLWKIQRGFHVSLLVLFILLLLLMFLLLLMKEVPKEDEK